MQSHAGTQSRRKTGDPLDQLVEGLRKNEILDLLAKSNLVSGKYSGTTKIDQLYKTTNIEGFLFPAQYSIYPGSTFDQAVDQMIDRFYIAAKNSGIDKGFKNFSFPGFKDLHQPLHGGPKTLDLAGIYLHSTGKLLLG